MGVADYSVQKYVLPHPRKESYFLICLMSDLAITEEVVNISVSKKLKAHF